MIFYSELECQNYNKFRKDWPTLNDSIFPQNAQIIRNFYDATRTSSMCHQNINILLIQKKQKIFSKESISLFWTKHVFPFKMCVQIQMINLSISILILEILVNSLKLIIWDSRAGSSFRSKTHWWGKGGAFFFTPYWSLDFLFSLHALL